MAGSGVGGTALRLVRVHGVRITGANLSPLHVEVTGRYVRGSGLANFVVGNHANMLWCSPWSQGWKWNQVNPPPESPA